MQRGYLWYLTVLLLLLMVELSRQPCCRAVLRCCGEGTWQLGLCVHLCACSKGLCGQPPSGSFPEIKQVLLHSASLKLTSKNKSGRTTVTKCCEACPACHDVLLFFLPLRKKGRFPGLFCFPSYSKSNKQTKTKSSNQPTLLNKTMNLRTVHLCL